MIIKCYFCQKEFIREWIKVGNGSYNLPTLFSCNEHFPSISFYREDGFKMEYKGFLISVEIPKNSIEIVKYVLPSLDELPERKFIMSLGLPETKDIEEFTTYLDRAINLKAFS